MQVDWRALIKSIQWLAGKEPRYCNFVIRAHFHDAGAVTPSHVRFFRTQSWLTCFPVRCCICVHALPAHSLAAVPESCDRGVNRSLCFSC